jgi:hypothetical protein
MIRAAASSAGLDEIDQCSGNFRRGLLQMRRVISISHDDPAAFRGGQLSEEGRCDRMAVAGTIARIAALRVCTQLVRKCRTPFQPR